MIESLLQDISKQNGISADDAALLIERAVGASLSQVMKIDAYSQIVDGRLNSFKFDPERGEVEIKTKNIRNKVERRIRFAANAIITTEAAKNDYDQVQHLLHTIVSGQIRALTDDAVYVTVELPGVDAEITAICPKHALSPGADIKYGHRSQYYVSAIQIKRAIPHRVEMTLSQSSKEFVAGLLREKLMSIGAAVPVFKVRRRIAGQFCEIEARGVLNANAVKAVSRETSERIIFVKRRP